MDAIYPRAVVKLQDHEVARADSAYILGKVVQALETDGVPQDNIDQFMNMARRKDHDHMLTVCERWVTVVYTTH